VSAYNPNDFDDRDIPADEDYRVVLEQCIHEAYAAIREANGYIDRQEDGPFTMRMALRDIEKRVSAIQAEMWYLTGALDRYQAITAIVIEQRDEAIRQRDLLRLFAEWEEQEEEDEEEEQSE
jgi:hypothetical protein